MIRKMMQRFIVLGAVAVAAIAPLIIPNTALATNTCGEVKTFFNWGCSSSTTGDGMLKDVLKTILKIIAVALPVVCMIYIAYGGMMIATAGGDKAKTKRANEMIRNAIISIIVFACAYALLEWMLPGGVGL